MLKNHLKLTLNDKFRLLEVNVHLCLVFKIEDSDLIDVGSTKIKYGYSKFNLYFLFLLKFLSN